MMKSGLLLAILLFAPLLALAQPKIEIVGGDEYNWGKVKAKELKGTIKIKNTGNQTLTIKEVKAGCGCTTTKIDKDVLSPGDEGKVDITLNISPTQVGGVTKTITVYSDDPNYGTKVIYLKADVVRPIQWNPSSFGFIDMIPNKRATSTVVLKNDTQESIFLDNFEGTNNIIIPNRKRIEVKAGSSYPIEVAYIPTSDGYISGVVKFTTTHPDYPTVDIAFYGNVTKPNSPLYK